MIICTNSLTSAQYEDAVQLISLCTKQDSISDLSFFEPELNEIPQIPCFYLLYEEQILISFISIFIPDLQECEIYGYTLPSKRNQGYFSELLSKASEQLKHTDINKIRFAVDPGSITGRKALTALGAFLESSEYLLKYKSERHPVPKHSLCLETMEDNNTVFYITKKGRKLIGSCKVDISDFALSIYDFEIKESERGNGYGSESLELILEDLGKRSQNNILLHVSGANRAAYELYLRHGFFIAQQIDYWTCSLF